MTSLPKVIFVVGSTGTGKTQLGIALARAVGGEVVNADAMQLYSELDVACAKVTTEEAKGIPHHLLSILRPDQECTLPRYIALAHQAITDILGRGKVPIVVGGTLYYLQGILFGLESPASVTTAELVNGNDNDKPGRLDLPPGWRENEDLAMMYRELQRVDPVSAAKLHPHDGRKIRRALTVYERHGRPASAIDAERGESPPLYDCIAFWVSAPWSVLDARLARRVDTMVQSGLWAEVCGVHRQYGEHSHGVFQSIGYKEFGPLFAYMDEHNISEVGEVGEPSHDDGDTGGQEVEARCRQLARECTDRVVVNTRRYSRRQATWLRNKLLPRLARCRQHGHGTSTVYYLNVEDVATFHDVAVQPAVALGRAFIQGVDVDWSKIGRAESDFTHPASLKESSGSSGPWEKFYCDVCNRCVNGPTEKKEHLASRTHRRKLKKARQAPQTRRPVVSQSKNASSTIQPHAETTAVTTTTSLSTTTTTSCDYNGPEGIDQR